MKTLNNMMSRVSLMTGPQIIQFKKKLKNRFLLFVVLLLVLYVYSAIQNSAIFYWLIFFILLIAVIYHIIELAFVERGVSNIILEHLDLDRAQDIYDNYSGYKMSRMHNNSSQVAYYYLNKAYILLLRGSFLESLEYLKKFNPSDLKSKQKRVFYFYVEFLDNVFNGQEVDMQQYETEILGISFKSHLFKEEVKHRLETMQALYQIVVSKEKNDYFKDDSGSSRIEEVMRTYCKGVNELNQGKAEEAKTYFAQIAGENSDLFYVREAKKYLEELS